MRLTAGILLGVWLALVLAGKSGFVHILLLNGIAIAIIDIVGSYRARVRE